MGLDLRKMKSTQEFFVRTGDLADGFLSQKYLPFILLPFGQHWCQLWGKSAMRLKEWNRDYLWNILHVVEGSRYHTTQLCTVHEESNWDWRWLSNSWLALGAFPINETIHNAIVCKANFLFTLPSLPSWATLLTKRDDGVKLAMNSRPFI